MDNRALRAGGLGLILGAVSVLALLLAAAAAAQAPADVPTLHSYFDHADEVVIGRVKSVTPVEEIESWDAGRRYRYKFRLSKAVVKVEKGVYNASPGDKTVYFASAVLLSPKHLIEPADPKDPDFVWKLADQHLSGSGLPLSFKKGERALLFLYRASSPRYPHHLPGIPDADVAKAFLVFSSVKAAHGRSGLRAAPHGGLGGKFRVQGESFAAGNRPRVVERPGGELEVLGENSYLSFENKRDWPLEHRADVQKLPLQALERYLPGRRAQYARRPRITVESAAFWRSHGGVTLRGRAKGAAGVHAKARAVFVNPGAETLTFRVVSAEAVTAKGRYPLKLSLGSGWDGRLNPAQERIVDLGSMFESDGEKRARLELTLADSEGKQVSWTSPESAIRDVY